MVADLLEKSCLTFQATLQRCYHAFYNIMSNHVPDIKEKCYLTSMTTGGLLKEDMMYADEAYDIMGFTNEEKYKNFVQCVKRSSLKTRLKPILRSLLHVKLEFYPLWGLTKSS